VKCVVPQICKAIKLAFCNIINCNQRFWLSPGHHWFSYFARQLRTLCRVKYFADSACRYCESWREYALSGMPRSLVTYSMLMEGVRFESNGSALHQFKISERFHTLWFAQICGLERATAPYISSRYIKKGPLYFTHATEKVYLPK